ncbi:actin-binding IPP [Paramuricea clavata]|uniref:Actin-binding IPP n=1 Tax=Paramuricea clavata TaxID=317549 RepID=A0A7D9HDT2_PARCT|nr:actin-binding IPP [Paramuricea clavata]
MVCGGDKSKRIEFLEPSENGFTSTALPGSLPSTNLNGLLVENRIITFGRDVHETSLQRPWTSTVLIKGDIYCNRGSCALERIGSDIFVIGYSRDRVERYDTANKQLRTLTSLPYRVSNMATVTYKDNIIILGGVGGKSFHPLNDVVMFNICNLECKRLPSMLQKRSGCAAVIMGDVVVVMGGESKDAEGQTISLKTAEYFVIGESKWHELPAMNQARVYPAVCVYP